MKKYLSVFIMLLAIVTTISLFASCENTNTDDSDITNSGVANSSTTNSDTVNSDTENSDTVGSDTVTTECEHSGGTATCTEQAVCEKCNEPYGEKLGHDWQDATCDAPKTCKRQGCGVTEGEKLGHDWQDATCDAPKTCKRQGCGVTEGEALGHQYAEEWTGNDEEHYRPCIYHPEELQSGEHDDADGDGVCDICNYKFKELFTFSARDEGGAPLKNAVFTISMHDAEEVTVITDEEGTVTVWLLNGEYSVTVSNLSAFFKANEESVVIDTANPSYVATFTESTDTELVEVTLSYEDGTPVNSGDAVVYALHEDSTNDANLLGVNAKSMAATFMKNEPYIFYAIDKDGNAGMAKYNKNGPTNIELVIERGEKAGSSQEHPLLINVITDLPYNLEDEFFKDEQELKAGESLYLMVLKAVGKTVTIDGGKFTLEYNGEEIVPNDDGVISLLFTDVMYGEAAVIKITAKEDAVENIALEYAGAPNAPIYVYSNNEADLTQEITFYGDGQAKHFCMANMSNVTAVLTVECEGVEIEVNFIEGELIDAGGWLEFVVVAREAGEATITFSVTPADTNE